MGIPLLDRRDFTLEDDRGPSVAVVNDAVTGLLSPNKTPLGQTIRVNDQTTLTVIGIVKDVRSTYGGPIRASTYCWHDRRLPPARRAARVDAMTVLQSE